ncbi:MAG: hypothetical protein Q9201_004122 [Fulgogasparrea decipioides]
MVSTNYSIYTIPLFYTINMIPHWYSVLVISGGSFSSWNHANPRSAAWHASFKKRVPAANYARWERARAAHNNGLENFPILVAAVILGNMAKLDAHDMNRAFGTFLVLRALYILAYINVTNRLWSNLRTAFYIGSIYQCFSAIVKAGVVLADQ